MRLIYAEGSRLKGNKMHKEAQFLAFEVIRWAKEQTDPLVFFPE
jgi:hypothetical protein